MACTPAGITPGSSVDAAYNGGQWRTRRCPVRAFACPAMIKWRRMFVFAATKVYNYRSRFIMETCAAEAVELTAVFTPAL
jgi:hypothetical protein